MTSTFSFAFLFLLSDFLRGEGSLNETAVGLGVHVLVVGRTIDVPATMSYIVFEPHFQFETDGTSASTKTDGVLMASRGFSRVVFGELRFEAGVTEKFAMTVTTTFGGFETARVGVKEIGALFLQTGAALDFVVWTSMTSCMVIGFQAVGTHVTGPEKPRETGDDIVMVFLVEQDQLFGLGFCETNHMEGTVCVHQEDLVVVEGGGGTELHQLFVRTRTRRDMGFFMELQSLFSLEFASLTDGVPFRVLVHLGFGGDQGPCTT